MIDISQRISIQSAIAPAGNRTNGTVNGSTIDARAHDSVAFAFACATLTDGTHAAKVQESSDASTWADVPAAGIVGTAGNLAAATVLELGLKGTRKRYVRAVVTTSGATTGATFCAVAVLANPKVAPTA